MAIPFIHARLVGHIQRKFAADGKPITPAAHRNPYEFISRLDINGLNPFPQPRALDIRAESAHNNIFLRDTVIENNSPVDK